MGNRYARSHVDLTICNKCVSFGVTRAPTSAPHAGCPSQTLLKMVKEVKAVSDAIDEPSHAAVGRHFALDFAKEAQRVHNKTHFGQARGHPALPYEGDYAGLIEFDEKTIPSGLLYPWSRSGKYCKIAGTKVQLINADKPNAAFTNALTACSKLLKLICEEGLGEGSRGVYATLLKAIDDAKAEPQFYAHSKVREWTICEVGSGVRIGCGAPRGGCQGWQAASYPLHSRVSTDQPHIH